MDDPSEDDQTLMKPARPSKTQGVPPAVFSGSEVVVADFNRDGHLDLAGPNPSDTVGAVVTVLLGNGDGTFQPAQDYPVGFFPQRAVVGDFNGDGFADVAGIYGGGVIVLLNSADWGRP